MADKTKHAYGSRKNLNTAIASGTVDAYDLLLLNGEGETPAIGWVDKNGNPVVISPTDDVAKLESQMNTELANKVNVEEVAELETKIAAKIDAAEVDEKINTAVTDTTASANAYTDKKLEAALGEYLGQKYEITNTPEGTLVNYRDKEIRVMCPVSTKWVKQNVGANGNANYYYMGFKAYAPTGAVSFKEDDQATIVDQTMYYFENNDFAGIDENGRKYSIVWLALASYDETTNTWTYFGANSTAEKYVGWYYSVEWYDADGILIASDCIRVNLSNEQCHSSIEPYYVGSIMKEVDTKIEEKILEVEAAYEIVEF